MPSTPAVYTAFTSPINPPGVTPVLTRAQVLTGLEIKVEYAQDFVSAIVSTDVVERREDEHGRPVTVREVVFRADQRRVREEVTVYAPTKVVFLQPDGSRVQNIISNAGTGGDEDLHMTYDFEWLQPAGTTATELEQEQKKQAQMSKGAVESTIVAMRQMVKSGRIKS